MAGEPTDFYQGASANFGANVTQFGQFASGYVNIPEADRAYSSRVRSAQANGAGPNSDPVNAPWNFTDFAFGRKTVSASKVSTRRGISLVGILAIAAAVYVVWKYVLKK